MNSRSHQTTLHILTSAMVWGVGLPCEAQSADNFDSTVETNSRSSTIKEIENLLRFDTEVAPPIADVVVLNKLQISVTHIVPAGHRLTGIELSAVNSSGRTIVVDGADATLVEPGGSRRHSAGMQEIERSSPAADGIRHKYVKNVEAAVTSFLTIGSVQAVEDELRNRASVPQRYGADQWRREKELSRFGKRILLPGQIATGYVFFTGAAPKTNAVLELTIHDLKNYSDSARLSTGLK